DAGDIDTAALVHGDTPAVVVVVGAEVGRIDDAGSRGVDLGHEYVRASGMRRLQRAVARAGEIEGRGETGEVDVAGRIQGQLSEGVEPAGAEIGGVDQGRIDDQRPPAVVGADGEADFGDVAAAGAAAEQRPAPGDAPAAGAHLLIDGGRRLHQVAG